MLVYEYKLDGNATQYQAIEEAIRTVQFIRNTCVRLWIDDTGVSKKDLQTYCAVLAKAYPFVRSLNSQARQASADCAWFAIDRFYSNCSEHKPGKKGYPQFQHNNRSVEYKATGWKLEPDGTHITFTDGCGIGRLRLVGNKKQQIETFPVKDIKRARLVSRLDCLLWHRPCYPCHCRTTSVYQPEMFRLRYHRLQVVKYSHTYLPNMWTDHGPRSKCRTQYLGKSALVQSRLYRGALGNRRTCSVKRFWTEGLYCCAHERQWHAPWMKEEPSALESGECQYK